MLTSWLVENLLGRDTTASDTFILDALKKDSVAYALFCRHCGLQNSADLSSLYTQILLAEPCCMSSEWNNLALIPFIDYSHSTKNTDNLYMYTTQSLKQGIPLNYIAFWPEHIEILKSQPIGTAPDAFYAHYYEFFSHISLLKWIDLGYHQTFERAVQEHEFPVFALGVAIKSGCWPIARHVLEITGNILWKDRAGQSLMHYAIDSDNGRMIQNLIDYGVPVHIENEEGELPLERACHRGQAHAISLLIAQTPINLFKHKRAEILESLAKRARPDLIDYALNIL